MGGGGSYERGTPALLALHLGPVHPSFRAFSGRLKFTARRHKSKKTLSLCRGVSPIKEQQTRYDPPMTPL